MIEAGYTHRLAVLRCDAQGALLGSSTDNVLLPRSECPANLAAGEELEVFVYLDRGEQRKATLRQPLAQVGEFALLQVRETGGYGAFLDWGIGKDLLAPFAEQAQRMVQGHRYLIRVCQDQQHRPIASTRLQRFLSKENQDLKEGEEVDIIIWAFTDLGAKTIVNHRYEAVLYRSDLPPGLKIGDRLSGYVARIRDDLRIDISLRRPGRAGVDAARETLLNALEENPFLPLHDQSPPELIQRRLGLSKKVFKKAVGGLYKDGLIDLAPDGIRRRQDAS